MHGLWKKNETSIERLVHAIVQTRVPSLATTKKDSFDQSSLLVGNGRLKRKKKNRWFFYGSRERVSMKHRTKKHGSTFDNVPIVSTFVKQFNAIVIVAFIYKRL